MQKQNYKYYNNVKFSNEELEQINRDMTGYLSEEEKPLVLELYKKRLEELMLHKKRGRKSVKLPRIAKEISDRLGTPLRVAWILYQYLTNYYGKQPKYAGRHISFNRKLTETTEDNYIRFSDFGNDEEYPDKRNQWIYCLELGIAPKLFNKFDFVLHHNVEGCKDVRLEKLTDDIEHLYLIYDAAYHKNIHHTSKGRIFNTHEELRNYTYDCVEKLKQEAEQMPDYEKEKLELYIKLVTKQLEIQDRLQKEKASLQEAI